MPHLFSKPVTFNQKTKQLTEIIYFNEIFMHHLSPEKITFIISSSAWQTLDQTITSAETNNDSNLEPDMESVKIGDNTCGVEAFADLKFDETIKRVLDVGGGKYDFSRNYMRSRGVNLLVWDPYNRSRQHNLDVQNQVTIQNVDAATSMAVLNVIPELHVRLAHIATLKAALAINGMAYFKVWPGKGLLKGSFQSTVNSYDCPGYQANAYVDKFLREVQLVFGLDNAKLHESIPNTIVARKISDAITSKTEIELIQKLSLYDSWHITKRDWLSKNYGLFCEMLSLSHTESDKKNGRLSSKL